MISRFHGVFTPLIPFLAGVVILANGLSAQGDPKRNRVVAVTAGGTITTLR